MLEKDEIKVYEGSSPYIFVSYSHKDAGFVYPLLRQLVEMGYRIWLDKGIKPGFNWTDVIAEHLEKSYAVLAIISDNSLKSEDCRRELDFAISECKPMIPVVVNDAKLNAGMKMQVSSIQSIYCKDTKIIESVKKALGKIEFFAKCKDTEIVSIEKKVKKQKISNKNKITISLVIVVIFVFIVTMTAVGFTLYNNIKVENSKVEPKEMYQITLTPPSNMSVKEFNDAISIIEERLEKFAGKDKYEISLKENTIELAVAKEAFAIQDIKEILKRYISRAVNLYFYDKDDTNTDNNFIEIRREDIESIEEKNSNLELVLTDDFVTSNYTTIKSWNGEVVLAQDLEYGKSAYKLSIDISEDGKKVEVFLNDLDKHYLDLVKFNWSQKPLAKSFSNIVNLDDVIEWEGAIKNSKQVRSTDFKEKTVTFLYETEEGSISEKQWSGIKKSFKKRLEVIEEPYAIGKYEVEGQTYLAIKTTLKHMGGVVMNMLGRKQPFKLQTSLSTRALDNVQLFKLERNKFVVQMNKKYVEELCEITKENKISISVNHVPLISTTIDGIIKDGKLEFSHIDVPSKTKINNNNRWLTQLMKTIWNDKKLPVDCYVKSYYFNQDENGEIGSKKEFRIEPQVEEQEVVK